MKEKVIVIVGPTAVGKTRLSIELAKAFDGEIINGDSMQVYKGLDIGTAKVTAEEAQGIAHHLIDIKEPSEPYTVSEFKADATQKIKEITSRNKLPIVVGGTGLYIESLLFDISHGGEAKPNQAFRDEMDAFAREEGRETLHDKLKEQDPEAAEAIHPNNVRRVIRALEVIHETGQPFSTFQKEKTKEAVFNPLVIGLTTDRALLYERINKRVDIMVNNGLLEEAKNLWISVPEDAQSQKGIGYKECLPFFKKDASFDDVIEKIKQHSRNYAKRQLTWFRNRFRVDIWADLLEEPEQIHEINQQVKNHLGSD